MQQHETCISHWSEILKTGNFNIIVQAFSVLHMGSLKQITFKKTNN